MIKQFINSFFSSNSYIYIDSQSNNCVLIDCGDTDQIIEYITSNKLILKAVFITHSHYDHIYGLNNLLYRYPNVPIYTSYFGKLGLLSEKLNLSKYHDEKFILKYNNNINIISNNEHISINNIEIYSYYTPGHDASCVTFRINQFVFTGDSFLPKYKLVYKFPKSDKILAKESEKFIISQLKFNDIICPGHGKFELYNLNK